MESPEAALQRTLLVRDVADLRRRRPRLGQRLFRR
jgi:hypothetical protein